MTSSGSSKEKGAATASGANHASEQPGEEVSHGVRVKAHPGLCMGYGNCHRFAADVYSLDDGGEIAIHLLEVPEHLAEQAWVGASVCPERAITVIGEPEEHWIAMRLNGAEQSKGEAH